MRFKQGLHLRQRLRHGVFQAACAASRAASLGKGIDHVSGDSQGLCSLQDSYMLCGNVLLGVVQTRDCQS